MTVYKSSLATPDLTNIGTHLELARAHNPHLPRVAVDTITVDKERVTCLTEDHMWQHIRHGSLELVGHAETVIDPEAGPMVRRDAWVGGRAVIVEYPAGGDR